MPPKNLRRSHTKSKAGCSQCKVRRIKCDELHPVCSNCERRQITCDFQHSPGDGTSTSTNSHPSSSGPSSASTKPFLNGAHSRSDSTASPALDPFLAPTLVTTKQTTDLDISDLELMHHWTGHVSVDIGDNRNAPSHSDIWQRHIPALAFHHEFLLRGLLCVAALHKAHTAPTPTLKAEYSLKASTHQDIALASFQSTLPHMNPSNCHALFSFSALLIPIAFATSTRDRANSDSQTDLFHWIYLLRGGNSILQEHRDLLGTSFLAPMIDSMTHTETTDPHVIVDADKITHLFKLVHARHGNDDDDIDDDDQDAEDVSQAYTLAIHNLLSTYIQASLLRNRHEGSVLSSLVWPVHLSPRYLELLAERRPEALVILAHYCVLIHWGAQDDTWFLVGWARGMLDAIRASLPEVGGWRERIAWVEGVVC